MKRPPVRLAIATALVAGLAGCSDRPKPGVAKLGDFRVVKFAGESVVLPFRQGLETAGVPKAAGGFAPKAGDRVVLADVGPGEIFLAKDLDALKFYHSTPGPDQLARFRLLGDEGRLFVARRGVVGSVVRVVEGELAQGLRAVELALPGPKGGPAWVGEPFVRQLDGPPIGTTGRP